MSLYSSYPNLFSSSLGQALSKQVPLYLCFREPQLLRDHSLSTSPYSQFWSLSPGSLTGSCFFLILKTNTSTSFDTWLLTYCLPLSCLLDIRAYQLPPLLYLAFTFNSILLLYLATLFRYPPSLSNCPSKKPGDQPWFSSPTFPHQICY